MTDGPYNQKKEIILCKCRKQTVNFTPIMTKTYLLLRMHDMELASKSYISTQYNYSIKASTLVLLA